MGVRRAVEKDFEAIHPLLEELMPADVDRRRRVWGGILQSEGYAAWVAEVDGRAVGFVDLFILRDIAHGGEIGLINNLVVSNRFRTRGLGETLLREAITHCTQRGAVEVHVWTGTDNTPAIGLFKKLGFVDRARLLELVLRRLDGATAGGR